MEEEEHLTVVLSSILITVTEKKPTHPDSKADTNPALSRNCLSLFCVVTTEY